MSLLERIKKYSKVNGNCWIWTKTYSKWGRGTEYPVYQGKTVARLICEQIHKNAIPNRHCYATCGNRKCVNPEHIAVIATDRDRFWSKVSKTDTCWEWQGSLLHGYGRIFGELVHRYSYKMHFGEPLSGMSVCHRCDNTRCVRPDHLFLGAAKDNSHDAMKKGRLNKKYSTELIAKAIILLKAGETITSVSKKTKINRKSLYNIWHSKLRPLAWELADRLGSPECRKTLLHSDNEV